MRRETRTAFHFGINFVFAPQVDLAAGYGLSVQQQLAKSGLVFDRTERKDDKLLLVREEEPLQVTIAHAAPSLGQLLIVAPNPGRLLDDFLEEASSATASFHLVWGSTRQIVRRDCTVRYLYQARTEHAFEYLWESRLAQSEKTLGVFGRGVLGGGLRLVMPAQESQLPTIEVKVESFLRDSTKLFVETQFMWQNPEFSGIEFDPTSILNEVNEFAVGPVEKFISGEGPNA